MEVESVVVTAPAVADIRSGIDEARIQAALAELCAGSQTCRTGSYNENP
jgi:hypothetical protein